MKPSQVTVDWLQRIELSSPTLNNPSIEGVLFRTLVSHVDGRGDVTELWSVPWSGFDQPQHVYQSATDAGVVKCWHLHAIHTDQFAITRGKVQVTVIDVREESPTFGSVDVFILGTQKPGLVKIPPGLLHGWKALSAPEIIVFNLQTHVYDPDDEYKFPWDAVIPGVWEPNNG